MLYGNGYGMRMNSVRRKIFHFTETEYLHSDVLLIFKFLSAHMPKNARTASQIKHLSLLFIVPVCWEVLSSINARI